MGMTFCAWVRPNVGARGLGGGAHIRIGRTDWGAALCLNAASRRPGPSYCPLYPPKRTQVGQLGFIDCLPIATVAWAARATGC